MAQNRTTIADPQGDFADWIELHNTTGADFDLTNHYLSDDPGEPRKWAFPQDTVLKAGAYMIVWADDDDEAGMHASFKLAAEGETIILSAAGSQGDTTVDRVDFGPQAPDVSTGRLFDSDGGLTAMLATPGLPNASK